MTGHQFELNLYHKEKEKSKNSTKYCRPDCSHIQYLDEWKKLRLLPTLAIGIIKTHNCSAQLSAPHGGSQAKQKLCYFSIWGGKGRKIQKK
jgi:hypothetical protein